MKNKRILRQFYTPMSVGVKMVDLLKNSGRLLEPSAGNGSLLDAVYASGKSFDAVYAVELDREQANQIRTVPNLRTYVGDFFSVDQPNFNSIIANPPYIRNRDILDGTRELPAFQVLVPMLGNANLYLYMVCHMVKQLAPGGELVCIVPNDIFNSTSGIEARKWLDSISVFTKVVSLCDKKIFPDADPDCVVFRYTLDCTEKPVLKLVGGSFVHTSVSGERLGDLATVRVGAVPASKKDYEGIGPSRFVGSSYKLDGCFEYYDTNKTKWIRKPNGIKAQLFVNCKTRQDNPFFVTDKPYQFDGSVLGIIPKGDQDIYELRDRFNAVDWRLQFLKTGNRFQFSQRTLTEALI